MLRRILPYLCGPYLVFLGWYGARFFGQEWRRDLVLSLVGIYAVITVFVTLYERHVRQQLDVVDPELVKELSESDADFAEFMADRPRVNERVDWGWRAADIAGGIAVTFYPMLSYTLWRHGSLTTNTPIDFVAVVLMFPGLLLYLLWRRRRIHRYRCPACERVPVRLQGEQIRFACASCGIAWRLGKPVIGDGAAARNAG